MKQTFTFFFSIWLFQLLTGQFLAGFCLCQYLLPDSKSSPWAVAWMSVSLMGNPPLYRPSGDHPRLSRASQLTHPHQELEHISSQHGDWCVREHGGPGVNESATGSRSSETGLFSWILAYFGTVWWSSEREQIKCQDRERSLCNSFLKQVERTSQKESTPSIRKGCGIALKTAGLFLNVTGHHPSCHC